MSGSQGDISNPCMSRKIFSGVRIPPTVYGSLGWKVCGQQ